MAAIRSIPTQPNPQPNPKQRGAPERSSRASASVQRRRNRILKPILWIACLMPLAWLVHGALADGLGANPVERITHATGLTALTLLFIGLAITPLRRWTGVLWLVQYRRLVGLFAFFYACLHLLIYLVLDQSLSVPAMMHDVGKRPFITMGALAWLCLLPLALTSTQKAMRRLGKNWGRLHRLVYVAAAAGAIHFYWLVKLDKHLPLRFLLVLAVLLAVRVPIWLGKSRATKTPASAGIDANRAAGAEMAGD
jgi:sulfoxide reductase heme-binding subunit YedZ